MSTPDKLPDEKEEGLAGITTRFVRLPTERDVE
jgi:hypothetical protein